ncbi:hypothetical protein AC249_AIPGENE13899 [Exaiptasia diaphana]|nr:hypothetical protein AC249_AIPGENE13899 [Exaiptasia diaphana]
MAMLEESTELLDAIEGPSDMPKMWHIQDGNNVDHPRPIFAIVDRAIEKDPIEKVLESKPLYFPNNPALEENGNTENKSFKRNTENQRRQHKIKKKGF